MPNLLARGLRRTRWEARRGLPALRRAAKPLARLTRSRRLADLLSPAERYDLWLAESRRRRHRSVARHAGGPLLSIVVPVHDTEPEWLVAAVESVRSQTYPRWELCLADDGSRRRDTQETLATLARAEPRLHATRLPESRGIAAASAAALALASGEFVVLLDHDDVLAERDALERVAEVLRAHPEVDLLYTDEDKLGRDGRRSDPFFKPGWSPDLLLSINYLGHLLAIRRRLVEEVGGFRPGYDGSQDYDLVLRATEQATAVRHLPAPLYSWRRVPGSAADVPDAKPYAFVAAKRALEDAVTRRGLDAKVEDGLFPGSYRVRYAVRERPSVCAFVVAAGPADGGAGGAVRLPAGAEGLDVRRATVDGVAGAVASSAAEHVLVLRPQLEPRSPGWLEALLEHARRPGVGAVGARIEAPDARILHAGVVLGAASHAQPPGHGYFGLASCVRECSAVAGCLLTPREVFERLGGLSAASGERWAEDYCLRARSEGLQVVYTPFAQLVDRNEGRREEPFPEAGRPDPYYNSNLSRRRLYDLRLFEDGE